MIMRRSMLIVCPRNRTFGLLPCNCSIWNLQLNRAHFGKHMRHPAYCKAYGVISSEIQVCLIGCYHHAASTIVKCLQPSGTKDRFPKKRFPFFTPLCLPLAVSSLFRGRNPGHQKRRLFLRSGQVDRLDVDHKKLSFVPNPDIKNLLNLVRRCLLNSMFSSNPSL